VLLLEERKVLPKDRKLHKLTKGSVVEEILVTVSHEVKTTPLTKDVKGNLGRI